MWRGLRVTNRNNPSEQLTQRWPRRNGGGAVNERWPGKPSARPFSLFYIRFHLFSLGHVLQDCRDFPTWTRCKCILREKLVEYSSCGCVYLRLRSCIGYVIFMFNFYRLWIEIFYFQDRRNSRRRLKALLKII